MPRLIRVVWLPLLALGLSGCVASPIAMESREGPVAPSESPETSSPPPLPSPRRSASAVGSTPKAPDRPAAKEREPMMLRATMSIPALRIRAVPVVPYRGSPDDGPGTRIQDAGVAASPFGARGGVGPGQVGNFIVTAHRTTGSAPFADLPSLRSGEHILVTAGGRVFDYRVTETRSTSFRSHRSLARQVAAVPGHSGAAATRARITLSTCATLEDHARGNYWADKFGNPEHRIDKIGVLVDVRPASRKGPGRA